MTTTAPFLAAVGDQLPTFSRTTGFAHFNRYAAVNDEFVPIHMDDEAGRAAGYPSAFGMGNLQWAYLHNLLRDWLAGEGRILRVSCQFRSPNLKNTTVTAGGTVTAVRDTDQGREIDLDVWTKGEDGSEMAPGKATVLV